MKNVPVILLLLIPFTAVAQQSTKVPADSLAKYSYLIWGFHAVKLKDSLKPIIPISTGFIYRSKTKIYWITAKHVLTGCDFRQSNPDYPPTMTISIPRPNQLPAMTAIPTLKIRDTAKCDYPEQDPDIIAVELRDSIFDTEHSAELFVGDFDYHYYPFDIIQIFGFTLASGLEFLAGQKATVHNFFFESFKVTQDKFNYFIASNKIVDKHAYRGFSGAPVFARSQRTGQWMILGVLSSSDTGRLTVSKMTNILYQLK
ncbi:MAG TPA: hypothetical protein VD993_05075 [Chitinophagaceae bacterium]|nr:hypothetical protein [Chitinophagaceae bacterium]